MNPHTHTHTHMDCVNRMLSYYKNFTNWFETIYPPILQWQKLEINGGYMNEKRNESSKSFCVFNENGKGYKENCISTL